MTCWTILSKDDNFWWRAGPYCLKWKFQKIFLEIWWFLWCKSPLNDHCLLCICILSKFNFKICKAWTASKLLFTGQDTTAGGLAISCWAGFLFDKVYSTSEAQKCLLTYKQKSRNKFQISIVEMHFHKRMSNFDVIGSCLNGRIYIYFLRRHQIFL